MRPLVGFLSFAVVTHPHSLLHSEVPMSLSPHEATLPSPTRPSHTLCCHRALLTASIVCVTHSLLTPSLPLAFTPTSEPPTPIGCNCCSGSSQSSCKPTYSVGLKMLTSCPMSVCFLPHMTPARDLVLFQTGREDCLTSPPGGELMGGLTPGKPKRAPGSASRGLKHASPNTSHPLYQPHPPTPEPLPAKDQALR